ncbi:MAG: DUF6370 family protein [Planctomycetota bacterium]
MRRLHAMTLVPALALAGLLVTTGCVTERAATDGEDDETLLVEAACGQCQFGLPGEGCDLAVRIDGQAYYVDGTGIDDHGDAHAAEGLCNAVRQARVEGSVEGGRFRATSFELVPEGRD